MRGLLSVVLFLECSGCSDGGTAQVEDIDAATISDSAVGAETSESGTSDTTAATDTMTAGDTPVATDTSKPPDTGKPCTESGAKVNEGHCYFPTSPMNWPDAKKECEKAAAHLVTVTSETEHTFVSTFGGVTERWIGLERKIGDPIFKESYKWITGEPNTLDKWGLTEPNASGTCGNMAATGLWADSECTKIFPGLCERD